MKNTLILLFAATTVALGAICFVQWRKLDAQKMNVAVLRAEMEQHQQQIAQLEAAQNLAVEQRDEVMQQASRFAEKIQAQQIADREEKTSPASSGDSATEKVGGKKNPFAGFLSKMMEDPETRKMIRQQQRLVLDQLYDPLIKRMNLTSEEAAQFKDLLGDQMMNGADKASSLFSGDGTNRTEVVKTLTAEAKAYEEQIRGFLGESRYAEYQDYQQTLTERTALNQFQQQNAGTGNSLSEQQSEQLLKFMKEEKQNVATATGQPTTAIDQQSEQWQAMLSGEGMDQFFENQQTVNQRVYDRAKEVLTADQLNAFGKFQTNQFQMMKMGVNMARKFMSPEEK